MTGKDCSLLPIVSDVVENRSVTKQYVSHIMLIHLNVHHTHNPCVLLLLDTHDPVQYHEYGVLHYKLKADLISRS